MLQNDFKLDRDSSVSRRTVDNKEESSGRNENCSTGSVYSGDLVVYKCKQPWDWTPAYGTVVNLPPNASREKPSTSEARTEGPDDSPKDSNEDPAKTFTVHWNSSNRMKRMKRSEICIIDRMLTRGTRVQSADGSKIGTIVNYSVKATVQIVGTNRVIQSIPLSDLQPISPFVRGQEILYKHWVGIITNVRRKVWFRFDGGLSFHIETLESDGFMKADPYWGLGVACPGTRTPFSPAILKNAKWTSKYMKMLWKWLPPLSFLYSFSSATISNVEASAINVKWLAPAPNASISSDVPPPTALDTNHMQDIQVLSMPNSEYAGVNSVRMYKMKPEDSLTTYGVWFSQFRHKFIEQGRPKSFANFATPESSTLPTVNQASNEVPVKILLRHNYVDVLWDDGKKERMLSIDVPIVNEPKTHEIYRIGMVVVAEQSPPDSKRYGIVQVSEDLVEAGTNTLRIHWFCEGSHRERVVQDEGITEESIYSLSPHPKYSLFQRETILFSVDPDLHEFNAGTVIDVDVRQGNMIIFCTDGRYRKVWPHMVVPFPKRCTWNFFTRKWVVDDIIPPPHQLDVEDYPKNIKLSSKEVEEALIALKLRIKSRELWEDPPFDLLEHVPECHWYYRRTAETSTSDLARIIKTECDIIRSTAPEGVWIRVYEDRMDLASVMIAGPARTPYEDGLFFFDLKFPKSFPRVPPQVHFISYGGELHPLLLEDGNFCQVNLNWKYDPSDNEIHQPKSYILEAAKTIQGLFFTTQPYFADSQTESRPDEASTEEMQKARSYNEMVFLQVLDSYYQMALKPHEPWKRYISDHVYRTLQKKVTQAETLILNPDAASSSSNVSSPTKLGYPLLPISRGFRLALDNRLKNLRTVLTAIIHPPTPEIQQEEYEVKPTAKQSSPAAALITTIEEIMHEQKREMKPVLKEEKEEDDDDDDETASGAEFSLADL